jgi:hypothetical protein
MILSTGQVQYLQEPVMTSGVLFLAMVPQKLHLDFMGDIFDV